MFMSVCACVCVSLCDVSIYVCASIMDVTHISYVIHVDYVVCILCGSNHVVFMFYCVAHMHMYMSVNMHVDYEYARMCC